MLSFDDAVRESRNIVSSMEQSQWRLGDLAAQLEPKYGESTLARFADEIGVGFAALRQYRTVALAWPEFDTRVSFSAARELAALPDRAKIIAANPSVTARQAQEVRRLRQMADARAAALAATNDSAGHDGESDNSSNGDGIYKIYTVEYLRNPKQPIKIPTIKYVREFDTNDADDENNDTDDAANIADSNAPRPQFDELNVVFTPEQRRLLFQYFMRDETGVLKWIMATPDEDDR